MSGAGGGRLEEGHPGAPGAPQAGDAAPAVVLVRPREEGNVGAAARAMANMGLSRLVLVEPAAALGDVARRFAVGAGHVLDGCARAPDLRAALAPFARVVATTSTRDRRPSAAWIGPRELPARLAAEPPGTAVALVFGPEVGGLTNEELARANLVVTVPCAPEQPTLNLAQAVLILAYELYQHGLAGAGGRPAGLPAGSADPPATAATAATPATAATAADIAGLFDHAAAVLGRIGFDRDSTFPGVIRDLRALAGRARLSRREAAILRGICRRAGHALSGAAPAPGESGD